MDIKGKVHEVNPVQQVTDSLKKQELIIEYIENPQYPEYLKFEAVNDRCALIDPLKVGDDVEVFFNLRGRPWTDKGGKKSYFNSMQLWKVNKLSGGNSAIEQKNEVDDSQDLPF